MKKKLFLDDLRSVDMVYPNPNMSEWAIVRDFHQFVDYIQKYGLPDYISFDHDLGMEHTRFYFQNGGHESPPDPLTADFKEKTGYDAAKWLVGHYMDKFTSPFPQIYVHSANPVGAANIVNYINGFLKHLDKEQTAKLKVHPFTIQEK